MAIRILMILLSLFILTNIIITIVSLIFGVNLYQKHGKTIIKGYGIFILFIPIQAEKALFPMLVTLDGIFILFISIQKENAPFLMLVTPDGISMFVKL